MSGVPRRNVTSGSVIRIDVAKNAERKARERGENSPAVASEKNP